MPVGSASRKHVASQPRPEDSVAIRGGTAFVGTNAPFLQADGEGPMRETALASFHIDATTVTNARFSDFVEMTGYRTEAERWGNSFVFAGLLPPDARPSRGMAAAPWWRLVDGANWWRPLGPGSEAACLSDHPVVHVTWGDAEAFSIWAGGRLPTEAEWEHAARGTRGDVRYPWGDRDPDDRSFFPCNIWRGRFPNLDRTHDGQGGVAPARSFAPNDYGLYNMCGNVWEYTSDTFAVPLHGHGGVRAFAPGIARKTAKGGSFLCHRSYCYRYRIAARTGIAVDSSTSHQGFRLVYPWSSTS